MATDNKVLPVYVVNAFTEKPFSGNPAAVCLTSDQEYDDIVYQNIAGEMNLSETAFIRTNNTNNDYKQDNCFNLRWFTPKCEVPLCGHATLASAAVVFYVLGNNNPSITFHTQSGPLHVRREGNLLGLNMPLNKPLPVAKETVEKLKDLINATTGKLQVETVLHSENTKKLLVRLHDSTPKSEFEQFTPNVQRMLESDQSELDIRGVIVTVKGSEQFGYFKDNLTFDFFVSRYFAPWVGINEDPVTGSAHTVLASYWSAVLGKSTMLARQCSRRGGDLKISILGDRVELFGSAIVVLRGELVHF